VTTSDKTTLLTRHTALISELQRLPAVTVAVPWPAQGGAVGPERILQRLWMTLAPDDVLGPWVGVGRGLRTGEVAALTAEGLGRSSSSADYGGVRGDATITQDWLVHRDWMITTSVISDCTMSALEFEIWAQAARLEELAAVVRRVTREEIGAAP
jgi:hypothetical protein